MKQNNETFYKCRNFIDKILRLPKTYFQIRNSLNLYY